MPSLIATRACIHHPFRTNPHAMRHPATNENTTSPARPRHRTHRNLKPPNEDVTRDGRVALDRDACFCDRFTARSAQIAHRTSDDFKWISHSKPNGDFARAGSAAQNIPSGWSPDGKSHRNVMVISGVNTRLRRFERVDARNVFRLNPPDGEGTQGEAMRLRDTAVRIAERPHMDVRTGQSEARFLRHGWLQSA